MSIERAIDVMLGRSESVNYAELGAARECIEKHLPGLWPRVFALAAGSESQEEYAAAVQALRVDLQNRYASGNYAGV